ncbi:RNA polymerase sigma factor [Halopseudomonas pelagia]|uniref:RNA polymerase sigma factor n=1 Tax=Halopseudomonas pelagia TaxID=553151 RepID=A0AA91U4G2_9GAMM|nr:RNA polymerase sigma factor [Halopseudomonas pelagia]PCD00320.1 RNA polymerase subunit sigma-24 [Halopseudomonas pelagia]QFY58795.1 RNA polymerase sigma factor [Halopseudomonas pelagia]
MSVSKQVDLVYHRESRRVLATLIRLLGDFELAEEAMQDAFAAALQQWPLQGVPDNPRAWLVSTGKHKGIDQIRRRQTASQHLQRLDLDDIPTHELNEDSIADDQLRLIFTCCHPALAIETQLAMTLREMCGLSTEQVARSLLQQPATVAQRIVRAKRKIREAGIPYDVPERKALPQRLHSVLQVIYLVFNEGYSSTSGEHVVNIDMAREAIRLGTLMANLLPDTEVYGLLALMLLQDSRRDARQSTQGELITLEDQDRSLWHQTQISEGVRWLEAALQRPPAGIYTLQAAIAAVHAEASSTANTDWSQIIGLYDVLLQRNPSPVIALNRAVAVAMRDGPQAGLALLDVLTDAPALQNYHLLPAARAELLRRSGQLSAAREAYQQALQLAQLGPEQRFLQRRLDALALASTQTDKSQKG